MLGIFDKIVDTFNGMSTIQKVGTGAGILLALGAGIILLSDDEENEAEVIPAQNVHVVDDGVVEVTAEVVEENNTDTTE